MKGGEGAKGELKDELTKAQVVVTFSNSELTVIIVSFVVIRYFLYGSAYVLTLALI